MLLANSAATSAACRNWRMAAVTVLLALLPAAARAKQAHSPAPSNLTADTTVYTYVEKMPIMQGGGGMAEMAAYIARYAKLRYCNDPDPIPEKSRIVVAFIVTETGEIRGARIIQGIGCGNDEAVLAAVRSLPHFIPGRQHGQPVAVKFVVPMTFCFRQ